ncbi:hypothetical protein HGRIS_005129 [Hohenbuehelia grisea]|uniref:Uncharacterized protein n=1 Tax=Hohenbuehelia grisea TaxID=104357 RepID=A0ABR3JE46_9AGAR
MPLEQRHAQDAHRRLSKRQRTAAEVAAAAAAQAAAAEKEREAIAEAKAKQQAAAAAVLASARAKAASEAAARATATRPVVPTVPVVPPPRVTPVPPPVVPTPSVSSLSLIPSTTVLSSSSSILPSSTSVIPKAVSKSSTPVRSSTIRASASANPSTSAAPSSGLNTGAMVGGIAGGLAAVALLSFAVVFLMRRKNKKTDERGFHASSFRRSAILLDDPKPGEPGYRPRPPSMIEQHIAHSATPVGPPYGTQQFSQQYASYNQFGQSTPSYARDPSAYGAYGHPQLQQSPPEQYRQYGLAPGFKYPGTPSHQSHALPSGTAALVAAAAYGARPASPEASSPAAYPQPSPRSPASVLPNPYDAPERQYSPPPTLPAREVSTPSPIFGINGQYVEMTREAAAVPVPVLAPAPRKSSSLSSAGSHAPHGRVLVVQNPSDNELPLPPKGLAYHDDYAEEAPRTPRVPSKTKPAKRPDTVLSTVYNPEDVYGGM